MTQLQTVEEQLLSAFKDLRPVGQIFIADGEIDTRICINNFFSMLVPEIHESVLGQFFFFSEEGSFLTRKEFSLSYNGSLSISASKVLQEANVVSPLGTVGALLYPSNPKIFQPYTSCVRAHFFTHYQNKKKTSSATVHPQICLGDEAYGELWRSSQSIIVKDLESLALYQPNPTAEMRRPTHELRDFHSHQLVAKKTVAMPPLSAAKTVFSKEELRCPSGILYLSENPRPAPNGKPLIMRRFPGGRFSMSHG